MDCPVCPAVLCQEIARKNRNIFFRCPACSLEFSMHESELSRRTARQAVNGEEPTGVAAGRLFDVPSGHGYRRSGDDRHLSRTSTDDSQS